MGTYNVIIEKDEDGYFVSDVIGLQGCHTQAKDLDTLLGRTKEAINLYLKCKKIEKIKERFFGLQQIEV